VLPILLWLDAAPPQAPFWQRLDALCAQSSSLASEASEAPEAREPARDELIAYCKNGTPPRFAARPYGERDTTLAALYATAKAPLPAASETKLRIEPETVPREREGDVSLDLNLGFAGQRMLSAVVGELCRLPDAASVLKAACTPSSGTLSLSELRERVTADLAHTVAGVARHSASDGGLGPATMFAWVLEHPRLEDAMQALASQVPACAEHPESEAPCETHALYLQKIGSIAARLLGDGPRLDRPVLHYENIVEERLRDETNNPTLRLAPEVRAATRELVDAMKLALAESSNSSLTKIATRRSSLVVLGKAASLVALTSKTSAASDANNAEGKGLSTPLGTLVRGLDESARWLKLLDAQDARGLFEAVLPTLETAAPSNRPGGSSITALRIASTLASAKDADDVQRAARDALVPVPAWVDRVVLDLNLSPPSLKDIRGESNLSMNGDMTVGYNGDSLGFVAHADSAYYDITNLRNSALTERYAGSLEAWGLIALSPVARLEPRLSIGGAYYGTLASDATSAEDRQTNQDSIMGRGTGLLGVRVSPSARLTAGLWAGGGVQYEDYYRVLQTSSGEQGSSYNVGISGKAEARFRLQWAVLPSVLSIRARFDYQRSAVRRDDQAITFSLGQVTRASQGVIELDQTEFFTRGFVDFEIARFFGFLPSVHAGLNTFLLSGDSGSTSTSVPVFGAGIRREAF
jgi:hypothetical protein